MIEGEGSEAQPPFEQPSFEQSSLIGQSPLIELRPLTGRLYRAGRLGMAFGFVSVAVLNVALIPDAGSSETWFSLSTAAVGLSLLWGERQGTAGRAQWFGPGGWVGVVVALFLLWLGMDGLFGAPAEPAPILLSLSAIVTGLFSLVASVCSFSSWWANRATSRFLDQTRRQPEASDHVEQDEEPFEIVELRGPLIWRHRYSVRVSESALEIRMPQLFGHKPWTIQEGTAIPDVGHLLKGPHNFRGQSGNNRGIFQDLTTASLVRPSELLWPVSSGQPYTRLPAASVTLNFDEALLSPKVARSWAWYPFCGIARFCRFDRRLVLTSIDLAERRPGELSGAMKSHGWRVSGCPNDWGVAAAERLSEHASSNARSLDRWAMRLVIALWVSVFGFIPLGLLLAETYERLVVYCEILFLVVGFITVRLLRRWYWTLFTNKHAITPAFD